MESLVFFKITVGGSTGENRVSRNIKGEDTMGKMNKVIVFSIIFINLMASSCFRDKSPLHDNDEYTDPDYPTILYSLPSNELQLLQQEFDTLNNYNIQTKLNNYGFTGERDYSKIHTNPGIKLNVTTALQIAAQCALKNNKFTNVRDSIEFVNSHFYTTLLEQDSTDWRLQFGPQSYNGYEVLNAKVSVFLYGDGVYKLFGFWYSNIHIPTIDNIDIEEAKDKILGEKIIWYDSAGEPNEFIVSENSIADTIQKIIFPLEQEESIELRVTWEIPIKFDSFIGWHIYIDTMNGETISIIQEFRA